VKNFKVVPIIDKISNSIKDSSPKSQISKTKNYTAISLAILDLEFGNCDLIDAGIYPDCSIMIVNN